MLKILKMILDKLKFFAFPARLSSNVVMVNASKGNSFAIETMIVLMVRMRKIALM